MNLAPTSLIAVAAAATMAFVPAGAARASEWQVDPDHTTAQFSVRHMMVTSVSGHFERITGTVNLDDKDPSRSAIEVNIDAASITTRNAKRDAHLKSPDFFDVAKHPKITFKSTKVQKVGKDRYNVTGDLTMRGVTHPVTLAVVGPTAPVKNPGGAMARGVAATGKISRKLWGLTWNQGLEAGGVLVGDEVELRIDAELTAKQPPAPTAATATTR